MKIMIEKYNPIWVKEFKKLKKELETKIHHYTNDKELPDFRDKNKTTRFIRNNKLNETNISEYF